MSTAVTTLILETPGSGTVARDALVRIAGVPFLPAGLGCWQGEPAGGWTLTLETAAVPFRLVLRVNRHHPGFALGSEPWCSALSVPSFIRTALSQYGIEARPEDPDELTNASVEQAFAHCARSLEEAGHAPARRESEVRGLAARAVLNPALCDWASFLLRRSHLLARGGPATLLQQASLLAPNDAIAQAARAHVPTAPWLRSTFPAEPPHDGSVRLLVGHQQRITSLHFHPDDRRLISTGWDGAIVVWDRWLGRVERELRGVDLYLYASALHPDGRRLVVAGMGQLTVWDLDSAERVATIEAHDDFVQSVALSGDGSLAVSTSADQTAKIWNLESGDLLSVLRTPSQGSQIGARWATFTQDGGILVAHERHAPDEDTGRNTPVVSRWEVATLERTRAWSVPCAPSYGGGFVLHPERAQLLLLSSANEAHVWDLDAGCVVESWSGIQQGISKPGGGWLACSGGEVRSFTSGAEPAGLCVQAGWVTALARSQAGRHLATGAADGAIRLWDLFLARDERLRALTTRRREPLATEEEPQPRLGVARPSIEGIVAASDGSVVTASSDHAIDLYDAETGRFLWGYQHPTVHAASMVVMGPDGRLVFFAGHGVRYLADTVRGREWQIPRTGPDGVGSSCARFLDDGGRLVCGNSDGTLTLWDTSRREPLRVLGTHESTPQDAGAAAAMRHMAISPSEARAFTVSANHALAIWDLAGTSRRVVAGPANITSLAFIDEQRVATGTQDGHVQTFSLDADRWTQSAQGHAGKVAALLAVDHGFVSAAEDGTVISWSADSGEALHRWTLRRASRPVLALAGDGRWLVVGADEPSLSIYDLRTGERLGEWEDNAAPTALATARSGQIIAALADGRILFLELSSISGSVVEQAS